MAHIEKRENKDGTSIWKVQIRIKGAPPRNESFESLELAIKFERDTEKEIRWRLKTYGTASAFKVTDDTFLESELVPILKEFLEVELDEKIVEQNLASEALGADIKRLKRVKTNKEKWGSISPKTIDCIEKLMPGAMTIRDMTPKWFKSYIKTMRSMKTNVGKQFTYVTIVKQMSFIRCAIGARADDLDLPAPAFAFSTRTMFPKNWSVSRKRRLQEGEEAAILRRLKNIRGETRPHWPLLFRFALETGARLQEMLLAHFTHFEEKRNDVFWIIPAANTKKDSERRVALSATAKRIYKVLKLLRSPDTTRVFHLLGNSRSVSPCFRRYAEEAGVMDFRMHGCRHEAISRMCYGKSHSQIFLIMEMVGHNSTEMLRLYCHATDEDMAKLMA